MWETKYLSQWVANVTPPTIITDPSSTSTQPVTPAPSRNSTEMITRVPGILLGMNKQGGTTQCESSAAREFRQTCGQMVYTSISCSTVCWWFLLRLGGVTI